MGSCHPPSQAVWRAPGRCARRRLARSVRRSNSGVVALTAADAAEVASWFEDDPEGQRQFGGFYGVHPKWWALVQGDAGRLGWTVREGDEPVGFVDMEINGREGSIAFYVVRHRRHA